MHDIEKLVRRLTETGVELVIIGGFAAVAHGASRLTFDLDICCLFREDNLARLAQALADLHPRFRDGRDRPLPHAEELAGFHNLYLETDWGALDVLSTVAGVGAFEAARERSIEVALWGVRVRILDLDALIDAKRALRRDKDRGDLLELELIRERLKGP